jgi:multidrug resistance efflux pump
MNIKRTLVSLVVIVILVIGGYWSYRNYLAPETEAPEVTVAEIDGFEVGANANLVTAEGRLVPARRVALAFQSGGKIDQILLSEGELVQAGAPVMRLDTTEPEINLRQAEAGRVQAEANLSAAEANLIAAQETVRSAEIGVNEAVAQQALLLAEPAAEEIAPVEGNILVAEAIITQAEANRDLALQIPDSQIRAAEAQVAAAIAERRVLQEQYDTLIENEIEGAAEEQARLALNAAVSTLIAAQATLNELREGTTDAQRAAADATVNVAIAQRDVAQAQLDLLLAGAKPEQATVAQLRIEQAEAALSRSEAAVLQALAAVAQAKAGVAQAEAVIDAARTTVEKMVLTAPFDGVIADMSAELGEVVAPGMPVLTIADVGQWQVETTDLTERDVVAITVGSTSVIRIDALPDETLLGTVTKISDVSTLARGDVTYTVTIRLNDVANLPLRWGMTVFADIDVAP